MITARGSAALLLFSVIIATVARRCVCNHMALMFQMNWLMRKRNIRTLPTKWTRLSPNFPDFNFPESELITNNNEQSYLLYFCYALESIYGGREVAVGRTDNKKSHLTTPETETTAPPPFFSLMSTVAVNFVYVNLLF